jgi:hypothetical protein
MTSDATINIQPFADASYRIAVAKEEKIKVLFHRKLWLETIVRLQCLFSYSLLFQNLLLETYRQASSQQLPRLLPGSPLHLRSPL